MGEYKSDPMPGSDLEGDQAMKILYKPHPYSQQRQREKKRWIWPVHLAMEATWNKMLGHEITWDEACYEDAFDKVVTEIEGIPFESLPAPDRILTKADDPKYQANGNYKYNPGTYIQSAGGCWWGKCTFCKECGGKYTERTVHDVIAEIRHCKRLGYREIFDDAASLPTGQWRDSFLWQLQQIDIKFSCNMRFGTDPDYEKMKEAGCRMLLYGLESASQDTLDRINKGTDIHKAVDELIEAEAAGLEPHVAVMFGYPWEREDDSIRTLELVHHLLRKGICKTAQASVYTVPDELPCSRAKDFVPRIYHAAYYPDFWINKLRDIKTKEDVIYIWKGIKSSFGI